MATRGYVPEAGDVVWPEFDLNPVMNRLTTGPRWC
jgi:hypothetical protein